MNPNPESNVNNQQRIAPKEASGALGPVASFADMAPVAPIGSPEASETQDQKDGVDYQVPPPNFESIEIKQNTDGSAKVSQPGLSNQADDTGSSGHAAAKDSAESDAVPDSSIIGQSLTADDEDDIDDGWVKLVKEVIRHTNNDPYAKQKKISLIQAQYLKKRSGIDLEVE